MADAIRKPRLTDGILDDLAIATQALQDEIDYLDSARKSTTTSPKLVQRFTAKQQSLSRAHDWLARHIEATRSQRSDRDGDLFESSTEQAQQVSDVEPVH